MASDPGGRPADSRRALSRGLRLLIRGPGHRLVVLNLALLTVIVVADWFQPAGVVVGILLCVPILLSSLSGSESHVRVVGIAAVVGWSLAAIFGAGPISPASVWIPNRVLVFVTIVCSWPLAIVLLRRARFAEAAHAQAIASREVSQLLTSLMAHDLRAPLALAKDAMQHIEIAVRHSEAIDGTLIQRVQQRLDRSLGAVDSVLALTRAEMRHAGDADIHVGSAVGVVDVIEQELEAFGPEALATGKTLELRVEPNAEQGASRNDVALREALRIVIDNAVSYADPGPIRVSLATTDEDYLVRVADSGPGISTHRTDSRHSGGSSIGLDLATSLLRQVKGELLIEQDAPDGTIVCLRVPRRQPRAVHRQGAGANSPQARAVALRQPDSRVRGRR
jgi:signal transduction histidine kinase